ncbi:hypothetical protein AB0H57_02350 [Micromonospora sp. NPDC050686]|uniref:hypothetical protein n=1 Tax=Micromonospora sp. NPDC050686 TaxID=3154631 RepID=UPI003403C6FE
MSDVTSHHRLRSVATTLAVALTLTLAAAAGCDNSQDPSLPSVLDKLSTPVLPLTVTTVESSPGVTEDIRGHVVTTDDVSMVLLQERGGVRYVPTDQVRAQVLCPSEEELPRHRLRIHDFHVEDSLLEGLGRRVRPVHRIDAACRTVGG